MTTKQYQLLGGLATLALQINTICVVVDICGKSSHDFDLKVPIDLRLALALLLRH